MLVSRRTLNVVASLVQLNARAVAQFILSLEHSTRNFANRLVVLGAPAKSVNLQFST